jgi:arginyl-tRNA synthetase
MNPTTTDGLRDAEPAPLFSLDELTARFAAAARALWPEAEPVVQFEPPRRPEFGDVATNLAFGLARVARKNPQEIAADVIARAMDDDGVRASVGEATPLAGLINLMLRSEFWQRVVLKILREGAV